MTAAPACCTARPADRQSFFTNVLLADRRRERAARGLTQEQLAECADLNPRTVQKIEAGEITILVTTLVRLRAALGCNWERLLG